MNTIPDQAPAPAAVLPGWRSVLAVVAHPDDESFALGAVLDAFASAGADVSVVCLTRGEASTVHGVSGDLSALREVELASAARVLGLRSAQLLHHPDGALAGAPVATVRQDVLLAVRAAAPDGMVVFDPSGVTGHPDHAAATRIALDVAGALGLPVLAWTLPRHVAEALNDELGTTFVGHRPDAIDLAVTVDRSRQRTASLAHASQAVPTSVLWRRLELLGDTEHLRWLRHPASADPAPPSAVGRPRASGPEPDRT